MNRKPKPAPEPIATQHPLERLQAAQTKLMEIETAIADVVRAVEAANISLLAAGALRQLEAESATEPLIASEQIEKIMEALTQVESPPRAELVLPRFSFMGVSGSKMTDSAGCRWLLWGDVEPGIKVWVGKPGQGGLFNA